MPYEHLAPHYDALMRTLDYGAYAEYLLTLAGSPARVLDLACGTGRLAEALCERGCDVVAVDSSAEMLTVARNRFDRRADMTSNNPSQTAPDIACGGPPLFLQQDMTRLDLYGTVEAAFCTLDALNYLTSEKQFKQTLKRVRLFLEPGGPFVFDLLTPEALAARDGAVFMSDTEDVCCMWCCSWKDPLCRQEIIFFARRPDGLWQRNAETHTERAYNLPFVTDALREAGFDEVRQYPMMSNAPSVTFDERVVFLAR